MNLKKLINNTPFLIRLFHWEYWPMSVVYFPLSVYYIWLAIKARSFFFFSATNPSIESGGMMFESKWSIFKLIPKQYFPKTIFISEHNKFEETLSALASSGIQYPFIAKPDRGERGWAIKKISDQDSLREYLKICPVDFLIQEYIDYPVELSVFYYRTTQEDKGVVSSVTLKELLCVKGNGRDTLEQLIRSNPRALLQLENLAKSWSSQLNEVLSEGQVMQLVPLGNHCRGATFLDYNHVIDTRMTEVFDHISRQIEGFYFGRFDLKCKSIEELKQGRSIAIVELNGSGAEPAHIYQPGYSFFKAQWHIFHHFNRMCEIGIRNKKNGAKFMSLSEFRELLREQKKYKQKVNAT